MCTYEPGSVLYVTITKHISAQNANTTGCTVNQTSKLQDVYSHKMSIVTKNLL
jgi:hypothetical protein